MTLWTYWQYCDTINTLTVLWHYGHTDSTVTLWTHWQYCDNKDTLTVLWYYEHTDSTVTIRTHWQYCDFWYKTIPKPRKCGDDNKTEMTFGRTDSALIVRLGMETQGFGTAYSVGWASKGLAIGSRVCFNILLWDSPIWNATIHRQTPVRMVGSEVDNTV